MDIESKLKTTRLNFAGMSFFLENLYKEDPKIEEKMYIYTKDNLLPFYENIKSNQGVEEVITTFSSVAFDAIQGINSEIAENKKSFSVQYPIRAEINGTSQESFKALFRIICKLGSYVGERLGAKVDYNEKKLMFTMAFD